jgi:hypothetical protein
MAGSGHACKACLASVAQERPRYYGIILARALTGRSIATTALKIDCQAGLPAWKWALWDRRHRYLRVRYALFGRRCCKTVVHDLKRP